MKGIFVSLSKQKSRCLFLLLVFGFLSISITAQTPVFVTNYKVGGTARKIVNGQDVSVPGAQVLLRAKSWFRHVSFPEVVTHQFITS